MKNISKQQIISILQEIRESYWTGGKNVSVDSININCPFCPPSDPDPSNHCGIFEKTGVFKCWRCEKTGPLVYLLKRLTGFSEVQCQSIIDNSTTNLSDNLVDAISEILNPPPKVEKRKDKGKMQLPQYFEKISGVTRFPLLNDWMTRRKIELKTLIDHDCGICRAGKYMNRLVIPVYYQNQLVDYQAADLTGISIVKYRSAYSYINDYLYNYDKIDKLMVVAEGVLDAWRVGDIAVASFGADLTDRQINLILDKKLDALLFCYDGDAYLKAKKLAEEFMPLISIVKVIRLPRKTEQEIESSGKIPTKLADYYHDPDSLGTEKILTLIAENLDTK